jgi:penicillin-binding protein 1C
MKSPAGMRPWRRAGIGLAALMLLTGLAAFMLDRLDRAFPPPLEQAADVSRQVVDRNGKLLRAYTTEGGVWRLPVSLDDVDPDYIEMLIAYEDRRFRTHPGIDPAALVRAAVQLVLNGGRIVSGGSTITMQLARLIEPRSERSVPAKLRQMARALQIERRMSKDEILSLYLTLAPYGGNLEGSGQRALPGSDGSRRSLPCRNRRFWWHCRNRRNQGVRTGNRRRRGWRETGSWPG